MPNMDPDTKRLQTLLAFAYGVQLGRARRLSIELQSLANQALLGSMASGAAIAVASKNRIECIASVGEAAPRLGSRPEGGLSSECISTGRPHICSDIDTEVDELQSRNPEVRSVCYLPLFRGMQPAGVLGVFSNRPGNFTEEDLRVLRPIGREITRLLKWEPQLPELPCVVTNRLIAEEDLSVCDDAEDGTDISRPEESSGSVEIEFATLDSSGSRRFLQTALFGATAVVIAAALGVGWWMFSSQPKRDSNPMVYGPPQVTNDLPVGSLTPPMPEIEAKASEAKASEAKESVAPLMTVSAPAVPFIEKINTQVVEGHTFVSVYLSGPTEFGVHRLAAPDRIYVDFKRVELANRLKSSKLDGAGAVVEFRLAKSAGDAARLVMVLKTPCMYLVSETFDPFVIVLDVQPRPETRRPVDSSN